MKHIVEQFKLWKQNNPDEDYQIDEIMEFINDIGRSGAMDLLEYAEQMYEQNKSNDAKADVSEELTGFDCVGKKAEVTEYVGNENFEVGTIVNILEYDNMDDDYMASADGPDWWIDRSDFKLLP